MFDKLEDLLRKFEEIMNELSEPTVADNQERFRALMKEQSDLTPLVEAYREYKKCNETVEDSLALLDTESDEEMREMLKEELGDAKKRIEELETQMKILLLPKDPNDDKMSSWKSVRGRAATRLHCLRRRYTECMFIMRRADAGKSSLRSARRSASAA